MKELIDKVSSYNLFNYLLPGILYVFIISELTEINLIQQDLLVGAFLYYFIGLIISKFGAVIVEPSLRHISFIKFSDYKDFVAASKKDAKIEILSETNNMIRAIIALFILIGLTLLYSILIKKFPECENWVIGALILMLFTLFLFAYRKQTIFITNRIKSNLNE